MADEKTCNTCTWLETVRRVVLDRGYGCFCRVQVGMCPANGGVLRLGCWRACNSYEAKSHEVNSQSV